eukprot:1560350-Karenia_brevis.AAC.1
MGTEGFGRHCRARPLLFCTRSWKYKFHNRGVNVQCLRNWPSTRLGKPAARSANVTKAESVLRRHRA